MKCLAHIFTQHSPNNSSLVVLVISTHTLIFLSSTYHCKKAKKTCGWMTSPGPTTTINDTLFIAYGGIHKLKLNAAKERNNKKKSPICFVLLPV
jgi:hypothetical protein